MNQILHSLLASIIVLLTIIASVAGISITGVYYDPIQAENGGEAIQLANDGPEPASLSTLQLATKSASYQLPSVTLLPGQGYLVADTGWSTLRDNLSWPLADYEVSLSLANTDGFVELVQNSTVIDKLAWNSSNATKAREGYLFTPQGEQTPFFVNRNTTSTDVPATITVLDGPPVITNVTITDDDTSPGVQLLGYNHTIEITVFANDPNMQALQANVSFLGKTYLMVQQNSTFTLELAIDALAPGAYPLAIIVTDGLLNATYTEDITVLSSSSIAVDGELTFAGLVGTNSTSSFTVRNDANTQKSITVLTPEGISCSETTFTLAVGDDKVVHCSATIPALAPGDYEKTVQLLAQ